MKKWLRYIVILGLVAAPGAKRSAGMDIGMLQPVQVVRLTCLQGQVRVETDTGDMGTGDDLGAALADMKSAASGEIFLDTADYLIVSPGCVDLLPAMMDHLRPSCGVCLEEGEPDLEQTGAYFRQHSPGNTLMEYRAGLHDLQRLVSREGRMYLVS